MEQPINRYTRDKDGYMEPDEEGNWVRYQDHAQVLEKVALEARKTADPVLKHTSCIACASRDKAIGQTPSQEVTEPYLSWLSTKSRSAGVGGNEAWNAGVEWALSQKTEDTSGKDASLLVDALEQLSRLGNGDQPGNSSGNLVAQRALAKWRATPPSHAQKHPQLPVAWMARYVNTLGEEYVYVTTHKDLAIENDMHGDPLPLYLAPAQETQKGKENDSWRDMALRFDRHRMQALWHLQAMLSDPSGHAEAVREFLKAPLPMTTDTKPPKKGEAQGVNTFEREQRYLVFKRADLQKHLGPSDMDSLQKIVLAVEDGRELEGKAPLECVVVESDWPEYESTWKAIEQRVNGNPAPTQSEAASQVAWRTFDGEGGYEYRDFEGNENYAEEWVRRNPYHKGWVEPLYTHEAPAQAEAVRPVAWRYERLIQLVGDHDAKWHVYLEEEPPCDSWETRNLRPLTYADTHPAPAQAVPDALAMLRSLGPKPWETSAEAHAQTRLINDFADAMLSASPEDK